MLTLERAEQLIQEGQISVWYSFDRSTGTLVDLNGEQPVVPDAPDSAATKLFRKNFFGDRLLLTLGPIIMSHNRRYFHKRPQFKNRPGYYNLLDDPAGQVTLEPNETISISTNERIALGSKVGAYIVPRLRNADAGLLYVPSYIDPYWDGILQGVIVNLSDQRQTLSVGEGIAICRFYEVVGAVPETLRQAFPAKSHHYGQTWPKILREDAEPFPRRKLPLREHAKGIESVKQFWTDHGKKVMWTIGALGLSGSILTGMFKYVQLSKAIEGVETLPTLRSTVTTLQNQQVKTGTARIPIPAGQTSTSYRFEVAASTSAAWSLWLQKDAADDDLRIVGHVQKSPSKADIVLVDLDIASRKSPTNRTVSIQWLLAP